MRERIRKIIILVLIAFSISLGVVSKVYAEKPCVKCTEICDAGFNGCAWIICDGQPVLCLRN